MKIGVLGPGWPTGLELPPYDFGSASIQLKPPVEMNAATLEEAVAKYAAMCSASLTPYNGEADHISVEQGVDRGYFIFTDDRGSTLVGLSVRRGGETLRPGHDLSFLLQEGDIVNFGSMGC